MARHQCMDACHWLVNYSCGSMASVGGARWTGKVIESSCLGETSKGVFQCV